MGSGPVRWFRVAVVLAVVGYALYELLRTRPGAIKPVLVALGAALSIYLLGALLAA